MSLLVVPQSTPLHQIDRASDKRRPGRRTKVELLVYSDTESEEACNHEYYDHDADDVENVH
jgi:hypothetical protein